MSLGQITKVLPRYITENDTILVKCYITNNRYPDINLEIPKSILLANGCPNYNTSLKRVMTWLNQNKQFILDLINVQYPYFWEENDV